MRSERWRLVVGVLIPIILIIPMMALGGCTTEPMMLADSAVDVHAGIDDELDFWDDIATRRVVTNNDALHGLFLLAGEGDASTSSETRVRLAVERGWMKDGNAPPMNASADLGMISIAICEIVEIKGGVTMRIFGLSQRYCTRELVFLQFMPPRTEGQAISGLEFIDLIGQAEDYTEVLALRAASDGSSGTGQP